MPTLKELRAKNFITQEELSRKVNISLNSINAIENGRQKPRFSTIRKLAEFFKVHPSKIDFS
jgi:DNA-binding XRE family transcriptional regulator